MIDSMKRLFGMAEGFKTKMTLSVILAVASVAAGIIPYFFISAFIGEITGQTVQPRSLYLAAAGVGGFLVMKSLLFICSTMLSHKAAYRILRNTRLRLAEKLTRMPLGYVLERDSGVLKKIMENDVEELERFLAHNIPETISSAVVPLAITGYLFTLDWRMTLALLACVPIAVLFYALMMRGSKEKMRRYYTAVDTMNAVVVEYVNGMKEIKAFNQSASSFSRFREAIISYRHYVLAWYKSAWPLMSAYYVLISASLAAVLPLGLLLISTGTLDFSVFILFVLISMGFAAPLIKLSEFADSISMVAEAEQNIHRVLDEPEMAARAGDSTPCDCSITFEDVAFSYNKTTPVLRSITFIAPAGKTLAIVGESGGGKSTIAKLICRFWDADSGSIKVGGADIRNMPADTLMDQVSFVFQDTFLFNISIGDNIRIGRPGAGDAEIEAAAKMALCHDFIMDSPGGYNTLAGDGGSRLSGGERQRICIARAILKNAPILVLDEATASIDPDSEEQIQEAIGALAKGKTLIVIAHRIRTIMGFDKILVVKRGQIIAQGSHSELLNVSRDYQAMYKAYTETENWVLGISEGEFQ